MHRNIPKIITSKNGTKGTLGSHDMRKLFYEVSGDIHNIMNAPAWRQKRQQSYRIDQMHQEITNNILCDSNLSQSYGNPLWYPPVPKYRIPESKTYTCREIAQIKMAHDIAFIQDNIVVSKNPLSTDTIEGIMRKLGETDQNMLCRTIIHEKDINIVIGYLQNQNFSYPLIVSCAGYMIYTYTDKKTNKEYLSNIFVYDDRRVFEDLISFLETMNVENKTDLNNAIEFFSHKLS